SAGNQTNKNVGLKDTNGNAGTQDNVDAGKEVSDQQYIMFPLWSSISSTYKNSDDKPYKPKDDTVNAASTSGTFSVGRPSSPNPDAFIPANTLLHIDQDDSQIPNLEETVKLQSTCIFNSAYDDDLDIYTSSVQSVGVEADFNNMESSTIMEPRKVSQALDDESWVEAMQEELLQFSIQKVWRLVDLPYEKKAIGTKWVYRNKKDKRGIVVRNKARLEAQGHMQEETIDYDEVFAPVARIEAIRIFLAFASYM
nr:copia protein [Tanacetum cinerariifolium]